MLLKNENKSIRELKMKLIIIFGLGIVFILSDIFYFKELSIFTCFWAVYTVYKQIKNIRHLKRYPEALIEYENSLVDERIKEIKKLSESKAFEFMYKLSLLVGFIFIYFIENKVKNYQLFFYMTIFTYILVPQLAYKYFYNKVSKEI